MIANSINVLQEGLVNDFEITVEPNLTYRLNCEDNIIRSKCDGIEAVKQAIYKILGVERYESMIYSWDYGIELEDLIGEDMRYVASEIKDRIKDALMKDDRIIDVHSFEVSVEKRNLVVIFSVATTEGDVEQVVKTIDV